MTQRTRRLGIVLALVLAAGSLALAQGPAGALPAGAPKIGMVCTPGTVAAGTHTFNLVANTGYVDTPDGNSIFMWSYANQDAPDNSHFQTPGPVLCATQGENVVVNLTNTLPEATSIVFPGQDAQVAATGGSAGPLTTEAAASGGTVSYSFTAGSPGTYLYQSGSDQAKQIEMGLYGALVVRPNATTCPVVAGTDCAYGATTRFDPKREYILLLTELDPDLHHAVETGGTYDANALHNRYFQINGREFPDTIQDNGSALLPNQPYGALVRLQPNTATNTQPALIRMLNAGELNHPFHPHGNHTTEIAQDGRPVAPTEHFGETIGSGQTLDYLIRWDDQDHWDPYTNQLPVAQPNYRNLTFKDGNTFYSGNPYLGYKGTLPTGTVQQNICGEWYFPWHSHALNEFANFDEGFGGMATLLRVDPPGGCFAFPTSTRILVGTLNSGSVANLARDDGVYYRVNSTTTGTRTTDWYGQLSGIPAGAANLKVTYNGSNSPAPARSQTLHIWNWTTSAWVQIAGPTNVGTTDVTVGPIAVPPAPAAGSWDSYIGTGANRGLVRIRVLTTGGTTNFVTSGDLMSLVYDAP
jgi:FtsP/CotA-like multicopper oxidase with cupredoxin domain